MTQPFTTSGSWHLNICSKFAKLTQRIPAIDNWSVHLSIQYIFHLNRLKSSLIRALRTRISYFSPFTSLWPVFGLPLKVLFINSHLSSIHALAVLFNDLIIETDNVLPLVVMYKIEVLQGADNILFLHTQPVTQLTAMGWYENSAG